MEITFLADQPSRIQSWKVKEGFFLPVGHVIFSYVELDENGQPSPGIKRLKAVQAGVIIKILVPNGQSVSKGMPLMTLGPCPHPTVMRDMCAECGMDLRKLDEPSAPSASVSMIHSVPDLRVSMEQAQIIGKGDEERLLKQKKLVLLVDLDQTLIHTTNDNVPQNLKDVFHFQLWGHGSMWYHTRLRPETLGFLERVAKLYELHICTFGTRSYAHVIARHLDPEGKFFSDRILSRDECFSPNSKTANLKELFPRGDHMVCIIDDREDVWNFAPNLIHVKPYHFFRHTGDINAPPGLTKQDDDDKTGISFSKDGTMTSLPAVSNESSGETGEGEDVPDADNGTIKSEDEQISKPNEIDPVILKESTEVAEASIDSSVGGKTKTLHEVKSDLSLSDEEESDHSDKSEEDANEGDMEESGDEKVVQPIVADNSKEQESSKLEPESDQAVSSPQTATVLIPVCDRSSNPENIHGETKVSPDKVAIVEITKDEIDRQVVTSTLKEDATEKLETVEAPSSIVELPLPIPVEEKIPIKKTKDFMEVEDPDDYLMFLEQILRSIHEAFYSLHGDMQTRGESRVPDVKNVIPYVRKKVLKNVSIVFSGVVPTEVPVSERKNTRAYAAAASLGAHISEKIIPPNKPSSSTSNEVPTTHIVAARLGTAKVNEARRYKGIQVVTPDWLWCCSERWEHVDERCFQLHKKSGVKRQPPFGSSLDGRRKERPNNASDGSPLIAKNGQMPAARKERTPSGRFMDSINPLLSFSMDEIESMGHEVDDICNESESSSSDEDMEIQKEKTLKRRSSRSKSQEIITELDQSVSELTKGTSSSSDSSDSISEGGLDSNEPITCTSKKRKRSKTETETEDEPLNVRFRRGAPLPSEVEYLNLMNATSDDDATNDQEEEWMARALEREFLDENSQDQE